MRAVPSGANAPVTMSYITLVSGYSDDITKVRGAIKDEYVDGHPGERHVAFDNGAGVTLARDDTGVWRIEAVAVEGERADYCVLDAGAVPVISGQSEVAVLKTTFPRGVTFYHNKHDTITTRRGGG